MAHPVTVVAARLAGTVVRITRRGLRKALSVVPGLAGAGGIAIGLGEVAGHVWQRGLTWWVALVVGGAFALWFAAELNRVPAQRRADDE